MTEQDILNTVVNHLFTQQVAAMNTMRPGDPYADMGCMYRGLDGTKCAVGCLIPDDEYKPTFENRPVDQVSFILREKYGRVLPETLAWTDYRFEALLESLQKLHDGQMPRPSDSEATRNHKLRNVARGLKGMVTVRYPELILPAIVQPYLEDVQ